MVAEYKFIENMVEKEKLFTTSDFYFSHSVYKPFRGLSASFIKFKIVSESTLNLEESKKTRLNFFSVYKTVTGESGNAGHYHFLLYQLLFSKAFFLQLVKIPHCVV